MKRKSQEEANKIVEQICLSKNYTFEPFVYIGVDQTYLNLTCNKNHTWNTTNFYRLSKGIGCPQCSNNVKHSDEYIEKLVKEKCKEYNYSYNPFEYIGIDKTYLHLTCNNNHSWETTNVYHFIHRNVKCPSCQAISYKVYELKNLFEDALTEKRFDDCRNIRPLPFDIFVPSLNLLIEYDGEQHFRNGFGISNNEHEQLKIRDLVKTNYAIDNKFNFIRIAYFEDHISVLLDFISFISKDSNKVQIHGNRFR